jgi:hypothetical protein
MGLCKCMNITDLFCFVHKKAVCQGCICPEHKTCPIDTYVAWLQDPEYEPPVCHICKDPVTPDNVLRLTCLHMFHPECIDVHCASFPPNTAQAGFTCPTCQKPIIPPPGSSSPLAQTLLKHLDNAPWLDTIKPKADGHRDHVVMELGDMSAIQHELDEDSYLARRLGLGPEPPSNPGSQDLASFDIGSNKAGGSLEGITSRKAPLRGPLDSGGPADPSYDVDDNKYEKHSIGQLWKNLSTPETKKMSLPPPSTAPKKPPRRMRITMRKILFLFAILSTLMTVAMLHYSLGSAPEV